MSRCSWNSDGQQCKFPGVMSHGLSGSGPWRCAWHFPLQGTIDDQMTGALIVAKSMEWDGTVEQYTEWRKAKYDQTTSDIPSHESGGQTAEGKEAGPPKTSMQPHQARADQHGKTIAELGAAILARNADSVELEPGSLG